MPASLSRFAVAVLAFALAASPLTASPPVDPAERAAVVGSPASVEVYPKAVTLSGIRDARQLVVTGKYADGTARDLTHLVAVKVAPADVVEVQDGLFLRPKKNGAAELTVTA